MMLRRRLAPSCATLLLVLAACGRVEEYDDAGVDGGGDEDADASVVPDATPDGTDDTEAPTITIAPPASPTNDPTPTFTFTTGGDPTVVECRIDGDPFTACTTASSHTPPALATDGTHVFEVRARDAAGNTGTASAAFVLDTVAPTITIGSGVASGGATNDTTPTWAFTTADDPTTVECRIDSATFGACATSYTAPSLAQGTHTFTIRASDAAGNQAMVTRSFTIDTTPPAIALGQVPASPNALSQVSYTWSTSGGVVTTECRALYQLNTVPLPAWQPCSSPHTTATFTHPGTITLVFDVRVRDAAGNLASAQDTFSHYVVD